MIFVFIREFSHSRPSYFLFIPTVRRERVSKLWVLGGWPEPSHYTPDLAKQATSRTRFSLAPCWQFDTHVWIFMDLKRRVFHFSHVYYGYYVWNITKLIHRRLQMKGFCSGQCQACRRSGLVTGSGAGAGRWPWCWTGPRRSCRKQQIPWE